MRVLIVGCGKFGVRVAEYLNRKNHEVTVVDKNPETFPALGVEFAGKTVCGIGFDKSTLEKAGIATADVVVSCTSSDSLNAVVANMAKNIYHVSTVIARMYDNIRARMFESMGIYTVSITRLGLENVIEYLEGNRNWYTLRSLGNGTQLIKARASVSLVDVKFCDLEKSGKLKVVAAERHGRSFIPQKSDMCEYDDVLYLAVASDYIAAARDELNL